MMRHNYLVVLDYDDEQTLRFAYADTPREAALALLLRAFPESRDTLRGLGTYEQMVAWCDDVEVCLNVLEMSMPGGYEPRYTV